jgi:class 3 adenylate cyclase/tetratricopeptide (TPR) repeat protein
VAVRKTVTVLFCDIVDSTVLGETLDPESLRRVVGTYFEECRAILERHGGRLEKFIGDAVVAIFGVPTTREDDALRALRAADEIRDRLEHLNADFERELRIRLRVRTGVHTGEVVVDVDGRDGFTTSGDTMNVAARLEQAAGAGEILIGAPTRLLGGDAIVVEDVEPLPLKGKTEPVDAFRLVRVLPRVSPFARRDDAPFVGRQRELDVLQGAFDQAVRERRCVLSTVVGAAGVGKSRLTREFVELLEKHASTLVGSCVAYGDGITFLPLCEALEPVLGPDPRAGALEILAGADRDEEVADRIAEALGFRSGGPTDDLAWAFRRLLEAIASERPLVLVLDDIHWAEATLLDLLEYLATFLSGSPILLLCLSRPELLEERPTWAAPRDNTSVTVLSPLGAEDSFVLLGHLDEDHALAGDDIRRIVDAADGNPLFLEQLLALNAELTSGGDLVVPPTIQALLVARLDQLEPGERRVLEYAAIEGRQFRRSALTELVPEGARRELGSDLLSLARRHFIRALPQDGVDDDDMFAFAHALVRDAAYEAIPKETRAELHVRLAEHRERAGSPPEIAGNHLAKAARYRLELGREDEVTQAIGARASRLLATGGRRALTLGDDRAAAKLLERACEFVSVDDDAGRVLRIELARAFAGAGRLGEARSVLADVAAASRGAGERAHELRADLGLLNLRSQTDAELTMAELETTAEQALPVFERLEDERGLAEAWWLIHWARFRTGRYALSLEAAEQAVAHARHAGDRREELRGLGAIAMATKWGPIPVEDALSLCDDVVARADGARLVEAFADRVRSCLLAMTGDFELGRTHYERATATFEELGLSVSSIGMAVEVEQVERLAGRLDVAEAVLRSAGERLREIGDVGYLSWVEPMLARVLALGGQEAEAVELARRSRDEMQADHAFGQIASRLAEAVALTADGQATAAEAVALEALELVEATDMLDIHGDVLLALAEIDAMSNRPEAAATRVASAIAFYERKGDVVSATRARERVGVA